VAPPKKESRTNVLLSFFATRNRTSPIGAKRRPGGASSTINH